MQSKGKTTSRVYHSVLESYLIGCVWYDSFGKEVFNFLFTLFIKNNVLFMNFVLWFWEVFEFGSSL